MQVLEALERWSKVRSTLRGGGGGIRVGLDDCERDEQAAREPRAEQPPHPKPKSTAKQRPTPPRAKPKPAALPLPPHAWESGEELDAAMPRPKEEEDQPLNYNPPPRKPTHATKPPPMHPRGKDPYGEIPRGGETR